MTIEDIDLKKLEEEDDNIFDKQAVNEIESIETPPDFNSEEWHEYVMRQFLDDELDNGKPIRDGLVRVTEKLIGPIAAREIISFIGANAENRGMATVHIRVKILVTNENHPMFNKIVGQGEFLIVEDGIAEVNSRNTPHPFNQHPAATASSKAEAQALRKVLRLRKMVAADEVTPDDSVLEGDVYVPDTPIVQEQITVIDALCRRLNMSVLDYINTGSTKYVFIEQVSTTKAQGMIKYLSELQSGNKEKPTPKPYDPSWRDKNQKRMNNDESSNESNK